MQFELLFYRKFNKIMKNVSITEYLSSTFLALCILLSRIEINLCHGAQASSSCVPPQGSAEAQVGQAPQEVEEEVLEEGRPEEAQVPQEEAFLQEGC